MEATFRSGIDRVLAAIEKLRSRFERIGACSEKLEEFDELARKALEVRKLRYEEWKDGKPKPAPTGVRFWSKPTREPAPTEDAMAAAYNLADLAVRQCVSTAEVARCSFKDKIIAQVDAISLAYQVTIDSITKCLRLFAEDQQQCASNASAGAGRIVKAACNTFGFHMAGTFQENLSSEAQDISTDSMLYSDPEATSQYPTIESQPILLGFSLPPHYFSCTESTKHVVNVFCQLVSFVHDHQAWDDYITESVPTNYSALVPTFRDLERSLTGNEDLNRDLLHSLGASMCAYLVKALLASFPQPLVDCSEAPAETLRLWNPDSVYRSVTSQDGRSNKGSAMALVPFVPPLHDRPQGKMLRELCVSLIPILIGRSGNSLDQICEVFSNLLTRKGGHIKHALLNLVNDCSTMVTLYGKTSILLQQKWVSSQNTTPPTSSFRPTVTYIKPTYSHPRLSLPPTHRLAPRPLPGRSPPVQMALNFEYPSTTSDIVSLKQGIVKTSKNRSNTPYTVLLMGETGLGKSSLLTFIANALFGNDIDHYDLDILDESPPVNVCVGLPHVYEITSNNGVLVRILDTPGLACIEHHETQTKIMVAFIEEHVSSVNAAFILGDSIVSITGLDTTLHVLSTTLPKPLASNIAFVFNSARPSFWTFPQKTLKGAPHFVFNNPIVLLREDSNRIHVEAAEQKSLEILVDFFNWLDGLEPQPATEIIRFYERYQNVQASATHTFSQMGRAEAKKAEIKELKTVLKTNLADMDAFSNFEKTVGSRQPSHTRRKSDMQVSVDEGLKKGWDTAKDEKETTAALIAVNEMAMHELEQVIDHATSDLIQLVEQFVSSSSTGRFSLQAAVQVLEQEYKAMEKKGIGQDGLEQIKEYIDHVRRKLGLLNNAKDNGQESVGNV